MAHFGMCSDASPVVLLRLFPSLVSPEAMKPLLPEAPGTLLLCVGGCLGCSEIHTDSLVSPEAMKPLLPETPGEPLLSMGRCLGCSEGQTA